MTSYCCRGYGNSFGNSRLRKGKGGANEEKRGERTQSLDGITDKGAGR